RPLLIPFTNYSLNALTYQWNFGDGSTSFAVNPSHYYVDAGAYTVTLTAYNAGGSDVLIRAGYVTVYPAPTADFTGTPLIGQAPLTVTFTNLSQAASSYVWEYGDGLTSTVTSVT